MSHIQSRLARLEQAAGIGNHARQPFCVRMVTTDDEERMAEEAVRTEGFDPRVHGEVAIIRLVGMQATA